MVNKKVDEVVFDALLEQAFSDVIEEDFEKLKIESESCAISPETELKIRKMIAKSGKTDQRKQARIILRVASVVLVVMLNLGLIGILMIPSVNAEVKNVFADLFEKYTSYETKEQKSIVVSTNDYIIGYIPNEFELIEQEDYFLRFNEINQGNGYIAINISYEDFGRISIDSENAIVTTIKINGIDAYLNYSNGNYTLFWNDGYHFITILSNIDEDEIIKVANNIKKWDNMQ